MEHTVKLPDLVSLTPFTWIGCNPHYSHSDKASINWALSCGVLSADKHARVIESDPDLFAAYAYPYASPDDLRLAADYIAILFICDEFTDKQSAEDARAFRDIFVDSLAGGSEVGSSPITLYVKDFMERFSGTAEQVRTRFVTNHINYMDAVVKEASLRAAGQILPFEEYIHLRRQNGGVFSCFATIEAALGIVLPAEVFEDDTFQDLIYAANDVIILSNDIYSFAEEHTSGNDFANAVSSLMHDNSGLSLQEAIDRACEIYKQRCADMIAYKQSLRSFGAEIDEMVSKYVVGLGQWICGYNAWQMQTVRFFGDKSEEANSTRIAHIKIIRRGGDKAV